jgi:hypothetical protein
VRLCRLPANLDNQPRQSTSTINLDNQPRQSQADDSEWEPCRNSKNGARGRGNQLPPKTEDDFFFLSHLSSRFTGLPFVVWIRPKGDARHDVRIEVSRSPKVRERGEFITVSVRPTVEVLHGKLRSSDLGLLREWIEGNRQALIAYWEGDIDSTVEVCEALRPLAKRKP